MWIPADGQREWGSQGAGMTSLMHFTKKELASALARGVKQCVLIGSPAASKEELTNEECVQVFAVDETTTETLPAALETSEFDKQKPSFFVWRAGYKTIDAMLASLSFIASLPKGSGLVLEYAVERSSLGALTQSALDALSSKLMTAGGTVRYLIHPQAVAALLKGVGFHEIVDLSFSDQHLVSASV